LWSVFILQKVLWIVKLKIRSANLFVDILQSTNTIVSDKMQYIGHKRRLCPMDRTQRIKQENYITLSYY
jgi:hypothetical protein